MTENTLLTTKHVLISIQDGSVSEEFQTELKFIEEHFCGRVFNDIVIFNNEKLDDGVIIYLCGDIQKIFDTIKNVDNQIVYVIKELSENYASTDHIINIGQVPINIHNAGVYFRNFFDSNSIDYFDRISKEHTFQTLTESNKQSNAFRTGIYLTPVQKIEEETQFNLLRCSTNLNGATDNFRTTDDLIVDILNETQRCFLNNT